jgi:hypothetical protein
LRDADRAVAAAVHARFQDLICEQARKVGAASAAVAAAAVAAAEAAATAGEPASPAATARAAAAAAAVAALASEEAGAAANGEFPAERADYARVNSVAPIPGGAGLHARVAGACSTAGSIQSGTAPSVEDGAAAAASDGKDIRPMEDETAAAAAAARSEG